MTSSSSMPEYSLAIKKAEQIYTNFYDPHDRAPEQIKLLVGTAKDIYDILKESEELLKLGQRPYPAQQNFNSRLEQTDAFIRKYCSMRDPLPTNTAAGASRPRQIWQSIVYNYDERKARKIHDGLMAEMHKFIQFILVLALRSNTLPPGFNSLTSLSGRLNPEDSRVDDIARRLSEIRYQVERRQIQASQRPDNREPEFGDLEEQIEHEWGLLCLRAGFEDRAPRPNLPSGTRQLLLSSGQVYNELIINHSRGTLITPRTAGSTLSPIISPTISPTDLQSGNIPPNWTPISVARGAIPPQSPEPDQHRQILGDPAVPIQVADIEMRRNRFLNLQSWHFIDQTPMGRVLNWIGTRSANTLTHYFPQDTLPYTTHTSLHTRENEFYVTFHGTSRVKWIKEGRQLLDENRENVKYRFHQLSDYKMFQEDLRDRHLIDTFDIDSIKTNQNNRGWGFVSNQDLKLWCNRDDHAHTLSFFADHIREHLEFPLSWFSPEIILSPERRLVQLTFLRNAGTIEAILRPQSFVRRFSGNSSTVETLVPDTVNLAVGSMPNSPRPSVSTVNSNMSALGPSQTRVQHLARLAESFQHLKIEFTRDDNAGEEDNYHRFVRLVRARLRQRSLSRTWTITED